MPKSVESANAVLEYLLRGSAYPTKHIALFSDTAATAEVALTRQSSPSWSAASAGESHTLADVDFPDAAAPLTIRAWAVMSASTGGIRLYWDITRDVSRNAVVHTLSIGDPCSFGAGNLSISEATS